MRLRTPNVSSHTLSRLHGLRLIMALATLVLASAIAALPHAFATSTILGDTTVEASTDSDSIGQAEAFAYVASGTGAVSTLSVYVDSSSTATTLVAGIYADSGGHPGALLAQGSLAAPTAGAWNLVTLGASVSVTSGTTYWLTLLGAAGSGSLAFRDSCCGSGSVSQTSAQTTLSTLPTTWSSGATWHDGPASLYAGSPSSPTPTPTATGTGTPAPTATLSPTATPTPPPPTPTPTPPPTPTPTPTGTVLFSDTFSGNSLNPVWTVVTRHGEYAQGETECNIPNAVSVANNVLSITTAAQSATCGDFNLNGSVRQSPSAWPYTTGDVQWNDFAFTYGTITYRAKFPPQNTGTWPAIWLLGANCQGTNIVTADTGYDTCPALQAPGYVEMDLTECMGTSWCHLALAQPTSWPSCDYPVDSNWHTYTFVWTSNAVSLSVDGQATCSYSAANGYIIPSTPMFLLIQTQTGGAGGTPNNGALPTTLQVSGVTVTQP